MFRLLALAVVTSIVASAAAAEPFTDVEIEKPFDRYLKANPLLMEVAGAKVIRLPDGNLVLFGVGSTVLKDRSAKERLRAETVCRTKALASIVGEQVGVQVYHVERVNEETRIVLENAKETGKSVSEVLSVTKSEVHGIARGLSVVGRWKSADGEVFYLAMGALCDRKGNPLPRPAAKD